MATYKPDKELITQQERAIAQALYEIAGTAYHEYYEDEDPGVIDKDDALEILLKVPGAIITLVSELGQAYKNPACIEGAGHGLARQFMIPDEE